MDHFGFFEWTIYGDGSGLSRYCALFTRSLKCVTVIGARISVVDIVKFYRFIFMDVVTNFTLGKFYEGKFNFIS